MYALKGPKMIEGEHSPNFPLKHAHKDIALACSMAQVSGSEYSVTSAAETLFRLSMNDCDISVADKDFSAIYEKIAKDSMSKPN